MTVFMISGILGTSVFYDSTNKHQRSKMLPWGTPIVITCADENILPILISILLEKKSFNHSNTEPPRIV